MLQLLTCLTPKKRENVHLITINRALSTDCSKLAKHIYSKK